jgi:hypothetical protein
MALDKPLRETRSPYTLTVDEQALREPVILEQDGQPVAALVPIAEYEAFRVWQKAQERRHHRQTRADTFEQERSAFERMKPELLRTHRGKVVAVYQGQVVQVGTDVAETVDAVYDQFGYVSCYVQRVEETPRVYKLPRRKVVR